MSDLKKEENKSPLDELRLFCSQNKKKWWFVLFFPSDLANELMISKMDSTKESIYLKYSFRRSWLGILQSLNFFSDPKILERMDAEINKNAMTFSGFETAKTEQNGDVQGSAQEFVTTSDLKGLGQTNDRKLKRISISQATIASSLSKQDSDILNFLKEPLNESLKASIKILTQESKDKLSTIIQMKEMFSKNLIKKIINKKNNKGMHDDRLLLLFYYLVENKQIVFPLDPRIENALLMLSEDSLQAHNQAIKDEKDLYKPVTVEITNKITETTEKKVLPNGMIGLVGFKLLSSFNNINDVMGKGDSTSLVSDVHDGSPADVESDNGTDIESISTNDITRSRSNSQKSEDSVLSDFKYEGNGHRNSKPTSVESQQSNVSVVTNGIDYAKIMDLFAHTRLGNSEMDEAGFLSKIKEISPSNQMIIYNIMTLYPKIHRESLGMLLRNETLLSEYGSFSQKLTSDYKTQINKDDQISLIKYMLMFRNIKSIESIYNSLNSTSVVGFMTNLVGVNPKKIQIINYILKQQFSPEELELVSLLLKKLPMTEDNIRNLKNFLKIFESDHAMLTTLKQSPVEILTFFSDEYTRDYFIQYKAKICSKDSVIGELYDTVRQLKLLGFSIQQINKITEDLTTENKGMFIDRVKELKKSNYYPINFNKDEIQGLLTIDINNFKAFISSIKFIEFLGENAVSMLAPSVGNNKRWKSNALIFEIFKNLDLSKEACYELLSLSNFLEKTEEELITLKNSLASFTSDHIKAIKRLLEGEEKENLFIQNITELLMCKSKEDILSFYNILKDFSSKISDLEFKSIRDNKKYSTRWTDVYKCLLLLDHSNLIIEGFSDKYLNKLLDLDLSSFGKLNELVFKYKKSYPHIMEHFLKYEDMTYASLFFEQISSIDESSAAEKIVLFNKIPKLSPAQQDDLMFCLKILALPCNKELFTLECISYAERFIQQGTTLSEFKDCDKLISGAEKLTQENFYRMFVPDPSELNQMISKYTTKTTLKKTAEVTDRVVSGARNAIGKLGGAVDSAGAALVGADVQKAALTTKEVVRNVSEIASGAVTSAARRFFFHQQPSNIDTNHNASEVDTKLNASKEDRADSPSTVARSPSPSPHRSK